MFPDFVEFYSFRSMLVSSHQHLDSFGVALSAVDLDQNSQICLVTYTFNIDMDGFICGESLEKGVDSTLSPKCNLVGSSSGSGLGVILCLNWASMMALSLRVFLQENGGGSGKFSEEGLLDDGDSTCWGVIPIESKLSTGNYRSMSRRSLG
ncbi:hypothetical protein HYC85_011957 [Camellia sinensis]|uniref:Uncharacterized protein n=1 Tax=Camellia sinensis TaxID=4442 RepID=A0A7J7HDG3_CAMSI|nr:hypothetical protein HYC85_011957 [Camellia sinensis]